MRYIILSLSVVAIAFVFSGCSKNNSGPSNTASVMFVNGCNGSSNIDTKVKNAKVSAASNLAYFHNSGYQTVAAGTSVGVNFYLTNQGTPVCNNTIPLTANAHYSIFAGGIITAPSFVITTDDLTAPTNDSVKVRFINLSSDSLNETFYIGSQKLDSNVTYTSCTPFYKISATTGTPVLVQDPLHAAPTYIAQISAQPFIAGKIYTIMLTGTSAGSGASALTLTVINNN